MPYKFNHPCSVKNCPNLAIPSERFCAYHRKQFNRDYNKLKKKEGQNRQYWSSYQWRKIRNIYLRKYPLCIECGNQATEVDHIIPVKLGGSNIESNLQPLCKSCHSRKTALEGRWKKRDREDKSL